MNKFFTAAAETVRKAFIADAATARFLEQTYVDVRRTARHWGA
jgi:hypothetical protein